jgi:hypothetical protein
MQAPQTIKKMSTNKIITMFTVSLGMLVDSCYYDKSDLLYPGSNAPCDSTNAFYKTEVMPVLNNQCYSCHTGASASGGITLGSYDTDKAVAQTGKLYGSVSHAVGFSPMPKGGATLNSCQLNKIKKWISMGTPNN